MKGVQAWGVKKWTGAEGGCLLSRTAWPSGAVRASSTQSLCWAEYDDLRNGVTNSISGGGVHGGSNGCDLGVGLHAVLPTDRLCREPALHDRFHAAPTSAVHQIRVGADFQFGGRTIGPCPPDVPAGATPDDTADAVAVLLSATEHHRAGFHGGAALGTRRCGLGGHSGSVLVGSGRLASLTDCRQLGRAVLAQGLPGAGRRRYGCHPSTDLQWVVVTDWMNPVHASAPKN